jgi:uncharacterized iron-regulated membrane protein
MARIRLWAEPPPKGAPKLERLLWFRGYYRNGALTLVPLLILGAVGSRFVLIVAVVGLAVLLAGFLMLLVQIRTERRRIACDPGL